MGGADDLPLTDEEFADRADRLCLPGAMAIAVSGGADSVALLDLAVAYARTRGCAVTALTVDHGLRGESAREATVVAALAGTMGIPHVTLRWEGQKPLVNLEAKARAARYALMGDWCRRAGVAQLLTAHSRDDQAETVLMRLARGSGVDGLAAMTERRDMGGIALVRPLLDVPRTRLEARLRAKGQSWAVDPMNSDSQFLRVRVRQARAVLDDLGLTATRLAGTARAMARARQALEEVADRLQEDAVRVMPQGWCTFDLDRLARAPDEIALRVLSRILMGVGGLTYRPRLERLERLYAALRSGALAGGRTLAGCHIRAAGRGQVTVLREAALVDATPLALAPGGRMLWDGRFEVALRADGPVGAHVCPVGVLDKGLADRASSDLLTGCPAAHRATLPGLWVNDALVSAPLIGLEVGAGEGFSASFVLKARPKTRGEA